MITENKMKIVVVSTGRARCTLLAKYLHVSHDGLEYCGEFYNKKQKDLENLGIKVLETVPTYFNPNEFNAEYLKVKKEKMGHIL